MIAPVSASFLAGQMAIFASVTSKFTLMKLPSLVWNWTPSLRAVVSEGLAKTHKKFNFRCGSLISNLNCTYLGHIATIEPESTICRSSYRILDMTSANLILVFEMAKMKDGPRSQLAVCSQSIQHVDV